MHNVHINSVVTERYGWSVVREFNDRTEKCLQSRTNAENDVETHILLLPIQKALLTPTNFFKAVRIIHQYMEGSALSLLLPGQKILHASGGCPAQKLLLFYCALFLVLLISKYSPSEILVNDLNALSLHH